MQSNKKGIGYGVVLSIALVLLPALFLITDILQTTRHSYSNFEPKSKVLNDIAQSVGCYGLPGGCYDNAPWFYLTFITLWVVTCVILYKKSGKLFLSSSDRKKFIIAYGITFPICFYIFAWGVRFLIFVIAVLKFGFV